MKAIFNARYYYEAGLFTDPIGCVRVEPHPVKGAVVIATDGHMLGIWHDEYGRCSAPVLVLFENRVKVACGVPDNEWESAHSRMMRVEDDDSVTILNGINADAHEPVATFYGLISTSDFPEWRNVLPSEETPRMDINPEYVEKFAKLYEPHTNPRLTIWISPFTQKVAGVGVPAVIKVDGRSDFVGVVMGMVPASVKWPKDDFDALRTKSEPRT